MLERSERLVAPLLLIAAACALLFGQLLMLGGFGMHAGSVPVATHTARLLAYLLLAVGAVLLPDRALPKASSQRLLVDAMMIVVAAGTFAWYFILAPQLALGSGNWLAKGDHLVFTVLDLVLLASALLLSIHAGRPAGFKLRAAGVKLLSAGFKLQPGASVRDIVRDAAIPLVVSAMAILIVSDILADCQMLYGLFPSVPAATAGRWLALLLLLIAAPVQIAKVRCIGRKSGSWPGRIQASDGGSLSPSVGTHGLPTVWRYLLPYVLIPAVVALMVYAGHSPQDTQLGRLSGFGLPVLYVCGAALIELVFVHQFLAYRELIAFSHRSARLESLAAADPITGMPNHRTIVGALDAEVERCRRHGTCCAVLFFDLDHFKTLNDTFGHRAGDAALREFASTVRITLRTSDVLGRWGGEEFVALLPETDMEMALAVAERVREAVESRHFLAVAGRTVTCSVGLASYPLHAEDRDGLVDLADQAMYSAKRAGRNQVRICESVPMAEVGTLSPAYT